MPSAPVRSGDPVATRTLDRAELEPESRPEPPTFRPLVLLRQALFRGGLVVKLFFLALLIGLGLILDFGIRALVPSRQAAQPDQPAEIDLRSKSSSSKLNFTSALSSVRVQTPTPQPETGVAVPESRDRDVPNPEAARPMVLALADSRGEPTVDLPELSPPPTVSATVIEIPEYLRYPHRGDTPMMRTWNQFGLSALLAAALAASPARAQLDGEPEKADAILKQLQTITKALNKLESMPKNLGELEKKIADAETRLATSLSSLETISQLQAQSLRNELNSLKQQYAELKQEMDSLKKGMSARQPTTTALYPPTAGAAGRLRLVNTYLSPVSIVVNNRTYRLEPGEDRFTDAIPAGLFTYEVLGIQDRVSRAILPGESYLIHVYPR